MKSREAGYHFHSMNEKEFYVALEMISIDGGEEGLIGF